MPHYTDCLIYLASAHDHLDCDVESPLYIGCYQDNGNPYDFPDGPMYLGVGKMTQTACNNACQEYSYFALQDGGWCYCGNKYGTTSQHVKRPDSECGGPKNVGRSGRNSIYKTCAIPGTKSFLKS